MPRPLSIDDVLNQIKSELSLSKETEYELLEEIRDHLEEAVMAAQTNGTDKETALLKVAEKFGVSEVGRALQDVHAPWESADAIMACFVPVFTALVLRWLAFTPDGTTRNWERWLIQPSFWIVALVLFIIPFIQFHKWRYTLVSWLLFWGITVTFIVLPNIQHW